MIKPDSQTRAHGSASVFTVTWLGTANYGSITVGDGTNATFSGSSGRKFSHTYNPCSTKTFTVRVSAFSPEGAFSYDNAITTEAGGSPCKRG